MHLVSRMSLPRLAALLSFCVALSPGAFSQQSGSHSAHDHGASVQRLGKVEFKVECNAAAQAEFNRGMALYHSFAWPRRPRAFDGGRQSGPDAAAWPIGAAPW